jgi:membrane fusion protein (multidrug efflux system)
MLFTAACTKSKAGGGQPPPPEVCVVTVQPEPVTLTTELPGRTSAMLVAEVRPQVGGIIKKRLFVEGSDVKAGDVLYKNAQAMYKAARASAAAGLSRAEANVTSIQARMERYKDLVAINAVSRQDYDDASAALKQAKADIEANRAALETASINLNYTNVTAPITGRIGKSNVTVGALATANQAIPFATIQQLDPIYVDVTQSSANLLRLQRHIAAGRIKDGGREKARVKVLLEDGTNYRHEGTLKFSDVTVDPTTGSFILRIVVPNPGHVLLPGMYVRAVVHEGMVERGILIPQQGVFRDVKGNPSVLVVGKDNKVQARMVTTDRAIGDKWLISGGLEPGERVIVEGIQKAPPGATVTAVPFGTTGKGATGAPKTAQPATAR